jgi:hypothetical protein
MLSQDVRVFNATMSCMHSTVTNLLQDVDDGMMMRTSPCWIRARHILPYATSRFQLSCHVWFGSNKYACTVSVICPSSSIKTRCIKICWKGDNDTIILVLVPAPKGSWIILCDHSKVLCHLFGPNRPCIMSGLKPRLRTPTPCCPSTLGRHFRVKTQ